MVLVKTNKKVVNNFKLILKIETIFIDTKDFYILN